MDILKEIEKLNEEELKKYTENRINNLEDESIKYNPNIDTIGFKLDYNPTNYHLLDKEDIKSLEIKVRCFYSGYIPKGIRIVYGMEYHNGSLATNNGNYYYVDDDSYIYDFCRLIRDKEVVNEYELFDYILEFIDHYFGNIKMLPERDEMQRLILEKENYFYKPVNEHSFTAFKGRGNAMCTEYSLMAQNIMSFFGIESYYVIGKQEDKLNGVENHAFNLINYNEDKTNKEKHFLIDYINPVKIYDYNYNNVGKSPFMGKLERIDQEFVNDLLNNNTHMSFKVYAYYILGNSLFKIGGDLYKDYYIDTTLNNKNSIEKRNKKML